MKVCIPLKELRLNWPALPLQEGKGIPLESFGYYTNRVDGFGYTFYVEPDEDCFLDEKNRVLLPIGEAALVLMVNNAAQSRNIPFSSFTILRDKVQVNLKAADNDGHTVNFYRLEDMYMTGEGFNIDEF